MNCLAALAILIALFGLIVLFFSPLVGIGIILFGGFTLLLVNLMAGKSSD